MLHGDPVGSGSGGHWHLTGAVPNCRESKDGNRPPPAYARPSAVDYEAARPARRGREVRGRRSSPMRDFRFKDSPLPDDFVYLRDLEGGHCSDNIPRSTSPRGVFRSRLPALEFCEQNIAPCPSSRYLLEDPRINSAHRSEVNTLRHSVKFYVKWKDHREVLEEVYFFWLLDDVESFWNFMLANTDLPAHISCSVSVCSAKTLEGKLHTHRATSASAQCPQFFLPREVFDELDKHIVFSQPRLLPTRQADIQPLLAVDFEDCAFVEFLECFIACRYTFVHAIARALDINQREDPYTVRRAHSRPHTRSQSCSRLSSRGVNDWLVNQPPDPAPVARNEVVVAFDDEVATARCHLAYEYASQQLLCAKAWLDSFKRCFCLDAQQAPPHPAVMNWIRVVSANLPDYWTIIRAW